MIIKRKRCINKFNKKLFMNVQAPRLLSTTPFKDRTAINVRFASGKLNYHGLYYKNLLTM